MNSPENLKALKEAMNELKLDILGISDIRRNDEKIYQTKDNFTFLLYWEKPRAKKR